MAKNIQEKVIDELNALYPRGTPYCKPIRKIIAKLIHGGETKAAAAQAVIESEHYRLRLNALATANKSNKMRSLRPASIQRIGRGTFRWKPDVPVRLRTGDLERQQRQHQIFVQAEAEKKAEARELTLIREEGQEYVANTVPSASRREFAWWFRKTYGDDCTMLKEGADLFMQDYVPPEPVAVPVFESEPVTVEEHTKPAAPAVVLPTMSKRLGSEVTITSRPDQAGFAVSVRRNCYERCVITGVKLRQRTEAAHLVEHSAGGADHWSNGLLLRTDIHELFDSGLLAICPVTLVVHIRADALASDSDLIAYHGKRIADTRQPVNPAFLEARWAVFQEFTV